MNKIPLPLLLLIMLPILLFVSSCSNITTALKEKNDQDNSTDKMKEPGGDLNTVELSITWWGGQERHARTLRVIELFEKKYPHIKLKPTYQNFEGYFEKLTTQFNAGTAPDIIQFGGNLNDYVYRGAVLPLNDYIGKELDISLHDQSMVDAAMMGKYFYGVTLGTNAWGVLLNKTMFDEASIPLPSDEWTWDEFIDISIQLSGSIANVYGTEYFDHNGFGIFIDQKGKILHQNGVLGISYDDVLEWFQLWETIREMGGALPPEIQVSSTITPEQSLIALGKVAMTLIPSNLYGAYSAVSDNELIFHPHPTYEGRSGVSLRPSQFLAGNANTNNPREVALFLDFIVNDKEAVNILGNDRGTPVNSEIREYLYRQADKYDRTIFEYIDFVRNTSSSRYVPNLPGYNETSALFLRISEEIAFQRKTVEEGATEYWEEIQLVLSHYRNGN